MPEHRAPPFNWSLWGQWVLLTTLAWVLGVTLSGDVGVGAWLGVQQWVVLRTQTRQAGWWILASALGWETGRLLAVGLLPPEIGITAGIVIGTVIGIFQWIFLRERFYRAGWWIIVSSLSWTIGLGGIVETFWVGTIIGVATGFTLELLSRSPRYANQTV